MFLVGYYNQIQQCPVPRIEYRYIPRTFDESQDDTVKVSQLFKSMFESSSPYPSDAPGNILLKNESGQLLRTI